MATENIFYKDALVFKKNKCYTPAFKYSDIVDSQPHIPENIEIDTSLHNDHFPSLNNSHHFFNNKKIYITIIYLRCTIKKKYLTV
jgi:hypothetical protein